MYELHFISVKVVFDLIFGHLKDGQKVRQSPRFRFFFFHSVLFWCFYWSVATWYELNYWFSPHRTGLAVFCSFSRMQLYGQLGQERSPVDWVLLAKEFLADCYYCEPLFTQVLQTRAQPQAKFTFEPGVIQANNARQNDFCVLFCLVVLLLLCLPLFLLLVHTQRCPSAICAYFVLSFVQTLCSFSRLFRGLALMTGLFLRDTWFILFCI